MQGLLPIVGGGFAPKRWASPIVRSPQQLVKIISSLNDTLKGFVRFSCLISTHHLGASKSAPERWVDLLWRSDYRTHPPLGGTPTAHRRWEPLHGGPGSISLEYQTYTSAYPFDTLVTGLSKGNLVRSYYDLTTASGQSPFYQKPFP